MLAGENIQPIYFRADRFFLSKIKQNKYFNGLYLKFLGIL